MPSATYRFPALSTQSFHGDWMPCEMPPSWFHGLPYFTTIAALLYTSSTYSVRRTALACTGCDGNWRRATGLPYCAEEFVGSNPAAVFCDEPEHAESKKA